ncbi:MAG: methionyl-tRNA formyltransferase [Patescibacteria group bacterium]|jgi:methionyl-tRNA formyltransferase
MKTDIIFFGTGEFGAAMLDALFNYGHKIGLVITQPDRPIGRSQQLNESAVKILAKKHQVKVVQPENLKDFNLNNYPCDLIVVCEYGLIIPKTVLSHSKMPTINVHTSLLPKFRGASPVQSAIINGEEETGITIMQMDEKMDHGAILKQATITIDKDDTYNELLTKMQPVAANLLVNTISELQDGKITPVEQNHSKATFCKIFLREDGKINWINPSAAIYNLYRGLTPWPGVWTTWNEKRLKITKLVPATISIEPGKVQINDSTIIVGCGNKSIQILELQLEGKNKLQAKDFIAGYKNFNGATLK